MISSSDTTHPRFLEKLSPSFPAVSIASSLQALDVDRGHTGKHNGLENKQADLIDAICSVDGLAKLLHVDDWHVGMNVLKVRLK